MKILKGPYSHNVWPIVFFFDRDNPYKDTSNLCKSQKNQIKNVDLIT